MTMQEFPIPFPGHLPHDDLASARLMIRSTMHLMENSEALSSQHVQSALSVLSAADEKLEVIQLFLDDHDAPQLDEEYRAARRLWVLAKGGAK